MKKEFKLGVIGGGFMANAIIKGVVDSKFIQADQIIISDCNAESLNKFNEYGCATTTDNTKVAENCDYLLFAIKPQTFPTVCEQIKDNVCENIISIMAGIEKKKIHDLLPSVRRVCRVMPNLPCSIGKGMVAADPSEYTNEADKNFISGLFSSISAYLTVEESKMHAVTGISGSGPAYVFLFIKSLIEAGKKQGLTEEEAYTLSMNTISGGVAMYAHERENTDIDTLIQRVCSKGGTTERAMLSFANDDMLGTVERAVDACVKRSEELAK